jgi:predicted ferric reductase
MAFSRVCYAMLPLALFLGLRPSPLPNTFYLQTVHLHKWVSRAVVLVGLVHGIMYFIYFVQNDRIHKLFKFYNFLGVITLFMMLALGLTSLKPFRQRFYSWFYRLHYPFAWLTVILGCIHARPGTNLLTFWCFAILIGQIVYRVLTSKNTDIEEHAITHNLKIAILPRSVMPEYFPVGSHLRVSHSLRNPLTWISPTHPYTIASHPSDNEVRLMVRETRFKLASSPNSSFSSGQFSVSGPYPSIDDTMFNTARKVLIITGGAGLSFGAAVYRGLKINGINEVKLIWIIKAKSELPALQMLGVGSSVSVFVTGRASKNSLAAGDDFDLELEDLLEEDENVTAKDAFELLSEAEEDGLDDLVDSATLIAGEDAAAVTLAEGKDELPGISVHKGRPVLATEIKEFFSDTEIAAGKNWVVACGPEGLVNDAKKWTEKQSTDLIFHGEKYVM